MRGNHKEPRPVPPTHHQSLFTLWSKGHPGKEVCLEPAEWGGSHGAEALGYRCFCLVGRSGENPVPKSQQPRDTETLGSICTLAL